MPDLKLCVVCSRVFLGDMTTCAEDGAPLVTQASDAREGRVLGNYRLLRRLGEGGVGAVYEAEHVVLGRKRAIKVLHPDVVTDELVVRFFNEARAVNEIRHPNIIDIEDFVTTEHGEHFLVMELLEGEELRSVLHRESKLAPARVAAIGEQIASALGAVHGVGIIHRDLKPENIFLTKDGDGRELAKLLDFGIAKFVNEEQGVTRDGMTVGTPEYMSPEQIMGSADVGPGTDIYALGMVMYEALTGAPAFSGSLTAILHAQCLEAISPPSKRRGESISPVLDAAVLKCLAKKRSHRFASAGDLVQALRADRPVRLASDSFKPIREVLPPRRRHHVAVAIGVAAAVAAAGVAFRLVRDDDTPKLAALSRPATPPPVAAPPAPPPPSAASPPRATFTIQLRSRPDGAEMFAGHGREPLGRAPVALTVEPSSEPMRLVARFADGREITETIVPDRPHAELVFVEPARPVKASAPAVHAAQPRHTLERDAQLDPFH